MKPLVGTFNQDEKVLVGAFSMIVEAYGLFAVPAVDDGEMRNPRSRVSAVSTLMAGY